MADNIYTLFEQLGLNTEKSLTDAEIKEMNKKYAEEVTESTEIKAPKPPTADEIRLMQQRIGEEKTDNYSKLIPNMESIDYSMTDRGLTPTEELQTDKPYDPNNFFIIEKGNKEFMESVQKKISESYDAPFVEIAGKRVYKTYYSNVEAWCLELFFEAVDWDIKIVEAVMHDKNSSLRSDIAGIGFGKLALAARGKK